MANLELIQKSLDGTSVWDVSVVGSELIQGTIGTLIPVNPSQVAGGWLFEPSLDHRLSRPMRRHDWGDMMAYHGDPTMVATVQRYVDYREELETGVYVTEVTTLSQGGA